jgi:hypothetical protein
LARSTLVAAALGACNSPETHVLIANQYDGFHDCLDPSNGVDVADGPLPSSDCPPSCITDTAGNTFVTTMCPPYPPQDNAGGTTGLCGPALAAWQAGKVCRPGVDGGGSE